MNAKLLPRSYRIEHDANEYAYFICWHFSKWLIQGPDNRFFMTEQRTFDYFGHDTLKFDTQEEAFDYWKQYVVSTFVQQKCQNCQGIQQWYSADNGQVITCPYCNKQR